jgi:DNA-binding transcriptional regulator YiaG
MQGTQGSQQTQQTNFYEQAIEWTHRADKVINLVLGYLLAIASVLGFMDVLSNGEVLSQVPYLFYVWLAIMGLGVDFQILLVVSRMPDVFRMPAKGWQKWIIFFFNLFFLLFLVVMSVLTGAIFTQHRDTLHSTIGSSMDMLHIDSILYVYGRAALATLLLVLMAVDRTMERWRMGAVTQQVMPDVSQPANVATPIVSSDLETLTQAMIAMNQQTIQSMEQRLSLIGVSLVEEITASISLPAMAPLQQLSQPASTFEIKEEETVNTGEVEAMSQSNEPVYSKQKPGYQMNNRQAEIEELLGKEPGLSDLQIANRLQCSTRTANKWRTRLRQPV